MRFITTPPARSARPSCFMRATRGALVAGGAAAVVLVGAACSGNSRPAGTPPLTATQGAPQVGAAAKQASQALKSDLAPLTTNVPLPLRKLDGITISMNAFDTTLPPVRIDRNAGAVSVSVGAIAKPAYGVIMALGGPSIESLMSAFGAPNIPQAPSMPTGIPTIPPGVAPGATPPAGFPTPPPGFATPPSGGIPTLPPGLTIPGVR